MAVYNTATNGLKDYKAAQEAYDAAVKGFYAATDTTAKALNDALFSAIDKHAKFLEGQDHAADHQRHHGRRGHHPRRGGVYQ